MRISRKYLYWLGVLIGSTLLLLVGAYHGFGAFKTWRAEGLASRAMQLLEMQDEASLREAWELARAAHNLRPENLAVVRSVASIYLLLDPANAAGFWRQAAQLSGGEFSDYDGWVEASVKAGDFATAAEVLNLMQQAFPEMIEVDVRRVQYWVAKGSMNDALSLTRQLLRKSNAGPEHHFLYIDITQISDDPAVRRAGIEHLRVMTDASDSEVALRAARSLGMLGGTTSSDRLLAAETLHRHAETAADRLFRLELLLNEQVESAAEVASLAAREFDPEVRSSQVEFGRWLNRLDLHEQTLKHIPAEEALRRQDLFLVYLDALAMTGQWAKIEQLLRNPQAPLAPVFEELFRMRTYRERGETRRAEIAWGRTMLAAGRDPESLFFIAQYTMRLGLLDFSAEALEKMAEIPALHSSALTGMLEVYRKKNDSRALHATLRRLHEQAPDDEAVANDLAYFDLLMGENIEASKAIALAQMEAQPQRLAPKMTYAFALYRQQRYDEALAFLETIPVDWSEASFRWRLLVAAILAENGREHTAFEFIRDHPMQPIFQEEREMLAKAGLL